MLRQVIIPADVRLEIEVTDEQDEILVKIANDFPVTDDEYDTFKSLSYNCYVAARAVVLSIPEIEVCDDCGEIVDKNGDMVYLD